MPFFLAVLLPGFFSKMMSNIDIFAFAKSMARISVVSGVIVLMISTSVIFVNTFTIILDMLNQFSSDASSVLSSTSSDGLSCLKYFLDALGITILINSFISSFFGLILIWSGFKLHIIALRFSIAMAGTALKVL